MVRVVSGGGVRARPCCPATVGNRCLAVVKRLDGSRDATKSKWLCDRQNIPGWTVRIISRCVQVSAKLSWRRRAAFLLASAGSPLWRSAKGPLSATHRGSLSSADIYALPMPGSRLFPQQSCSGSSPAMCDAKTFDKAVPHALSEAISGFRGELRSHLHSTRRAFLTKSTLTTLFELTAAFRVCRF